VGAGWGSLRHGTRPAGAGARDGGGVLEGWHEAVGAHKGTRGTGEGRLEGRARDGNGAGGSAGKGRLEMPRVGDGAGSETGAWQEDDVGEAHLEASQGGDSTGEGRLERAVLRQWARDGGARDGAGQDGELRWHGLETVAGWEMAQARAISRGPSQAAGSRRWARDGVGCESGGGRGRRSR